jgi:hypothetical protein
VRLDRGDVARRIGGDRRERAVPSALDIHLAGRRQRQYPQDPDDSSLVAASPPVPRSLHADQRVVDEPLERWFAALTDKQRRRGVHRSPRELAAAIRRYIDLTNERPKPFKWTKTADEILASVTRFCHRISNSGH